MSNENQARKITTEDYENMKAAIEADQARGDGRVTINPEAIAAVAKDFNISEDEARGFLVCGFLFADVLSEVALYGLGREITTAIMVKQAQLSKAHYAHTTN